MAVFMNRRLLPNPACRIAHRILFDLRFVPFSAVECEKTEPKLLWYFPHKIIVDSSRKLASDSAHGRLRQMESALDHPIDFA
jgi:hypothetical protein